MFDDFRPAGLTSDEAARWANHGFTPTEAAAWIGAGFTARAASRWANQHVDPVEARSRVARIGNDRLGRGMDAPCEACAA